MTSTSNYGATFTDNYIQLMDRFKEKEYVGIAEMKAALELFDYRADSSGNMFEIYIPDQNRLDALLATQQFWDGQALSAFQNSKFGGQIFTTVIRNIPDYNKVPDTELYNNIRDGLSSDMKLSIEEAGLLVDMLEDIKVAELSALLEVAEYDAIPYLIDKGAVEHVITDEPTPIRRPYYEDEPFSAEDIERVLDLLRHTYRPGSWDFDISNSVNSVAEENDLVLNYEASISNQQNQNTYDVYVDQHAARIVLVDQTGATSDVMSLRDIEFIYSLE